MYNSKDIEEYSDHHKIFTHCSRFFQSNDLATSLLISGSATNKTLDQYSDLDLGIVCSSDKARDLLWKDRWAWEIAPWFHRFDADHIKSHFVIYFFEPNVHTDLCLYTLEDLPSFPGVQVVWDKSGDTSSIYTDQQIVPFKLEHSEIVHDDERFWAWIHYCASHAHRGEYYGCASFFPDIRGIHEKWIAYLDSGEPFSPRRLEMSKKNNYVETLRFAFPSPDKESVFNALELSVTLHKELREKLARIHAVDFSVSSESMAHIESYLQDGRPL